MINIALIANHDLTYFYHEIALQLQKKQINIFWITPSPKQGNWLSEKYSTGNVLNISLNSPKNEPIAEMNLNELIYGDRVLKYNKIKGIAYLENIQKPIYDFIKNNRIKFIFGEKTWAHEELIYRIIDDFTELNCKFLSPAGIRIPIGRFSFFEEPQMNTIYKKPICEKENNNEQNKLIEIETPDYLKRNDYLLKKKNSLLGMFLRFCKLISFQNADTGSPCRLELKYILKAKYKEFFNRRYYYSLSRPGFKEITKPFVFVTLHLQPESSVDIRGRYYEDQKTNVINLWRKLPQDWLLVVKEHSNAVGCRGKDFFEDLLELPNLVLVDEKESSLNYIESAKAVVSITGTIGLEALILNKIALMLGNAHFVGFGSCYSISLDKIVDCDNLEVLIKDVEKIVQPNKFELDKFMLQNSFEGIISDPLSNPGCMTIENINKVAKAFYSIIKIKEQSFTLK